MNYDFIIIEFHASKDQLDEKLLIIKDVLYMACKSTRLIELSYIE